MAVYSIVKIGDPILREKAKPVKEASPSLNRLLQNMAETMYEAKGVGLAAPQIGVSKRVIVIDVGEGLLEIINPEVVEATGEETDVEGCLSVPGVIGKVARYTYMRVKGRDRNWQAVEITGQGLLARALQHEIDHLEGILFVDKAETLEKTSENVPG
ncbi:MAG: peptide deformylase [Bacillota bacterium]